MDAQIQSRLSEPMARLSKEVQRATAEMIGKEEVRFLIDRYYQVQEDRKRSDNQIRSLAGTDTPHDVLTWLSATNTAIEKTLKDILDLWSDGQHTCRWAKSIHGIGPIIASGLEAHIDMERAPTAGHIWSYAGLNPNQVWKKGHKRPWNARLKTLCWKIGESFQKSSAEKSFYRQLYDERKAYEQKKNDALEYKAQAEAALAKKKFDKSTVAYKHYSKGMLPPGHINERVKRYVTKMFLAQWHHVAYLDHYGEKPPKPYIFCYPQNEVEHVHMITPDNVF